MGAGPSGELDHTLGVDVVWPALRPVVLLEWWDGSMTCLLTPSRLCHALPCLDGGMERLPTPKRLPFPFAVSRTRLWSAVTKSWSCASVLPAAGSRATDQTHCGPLFHYSFLASLIWSSREREREMRATSAADHNFGNDSTRDGWAERAGAPLTAAGALRFVRSTPSRVEAPTPPSRAALLARPDESPEK
ncbi:hypothetical protein B296_00036132 [Ensete ventricosum]|uniref:Uncharacterized protein n=1 Tax=Ensete ventricosum TaxID=4639 RepID=A0A426ZHJ3_ENSVE|nr:hypothetical protein B296_00036132 [Ensete ventricosum]